jgi:arylsulfatase B
MPPLSSADDGFESLACGRDVGMATEGHHPRARGFESFYGYWHHANDYWNHAVGKCSAMPLVRDLWRFNATFDGPAVADENGPGCSQREQQPSGETCVFEEELLRSEAIRLITRHDASEPLFLFYSSHLIHVPLQVPKKYEEAFSFIEDPFRRVSHAMSNLLDETVGAMVSALKARQMWSTTLFAFHADNGGEIMGAGTCGGNNWPLTGGKFSNWEGGIRVNAFVAGGVVPASRRGGIEASLTAVWDWYATYAHLAGIDPTDHTAASAGLPPIDSVNMWPLISGKRASSDAAPRPPPTDADVSGVAPRAELVIGETTALSPNGDGRTLVGGLLRVNGSDHIFKLLVGAPDRKYTIDQYVQTGPSWPNRSSHLVPLSHFKLCARDHAHGCLFDVASDPYERYNLAESMPGLFAEMLARVDELQKGVYSPVRGKEDARACTAAKAKYGGYWGPFIDTPE